MKNLKAFLPFLVLAAGTLFAYYGIQNKISFLAGVGFVFLAIGLVFVGFDNISKRHLDEYNDAGKRIASYSGLAVIFIGLFWCILGAAVFLLGIFFLFDFQENIFTWIQQHPGIPFLLGGAMLISYNLHEFLGSNQERASLLPFLGSLPKRILSVLLIGIGICLCLLGLFALFLPGQYQSLMSVFANQYEQFQCSFSPILCEE
jgi:uncharacterized protein YjeT (DUF2065 family)